MGDKSYICLYSVIYNDEDGNNKIDYGMIFANGFADASGYLERVLYGEDLVQICHMELFDTCPVFSKETWEMIQKELNDH